MPKTLVEWQTKVNPEELDPATDPATDPAVDPATDPAEDVDNAWGAADPADEGQKDPADGDTDLSQLLSKYGENVVTGMIEEKEKVEAVIADPKQMESMTKEQIVQLYQLRDNLNSQLWEILPALSEKRQAEFAKVVDGIEDEGVKSVVLESIKDVENESEATAIVEFAKKIIEAVGWAKKPDDGWDAADPANPWAIKAALKGGKQEIVEDMNISEWLMSEDPEIRAKAKKAADAAFAQISAQ